MIYGGYLVGALCFGKSAEVLISSNTPLVNEMHLTSLELFVACYENNAPGTIIAKGISSDYAKDTEARFKETTDSLVQKIKDIESHPDYKKQVEEITNAGLKCWGYQLIGLLTAGAAGFYHIKSKIKEK